MMMSSMSQSRAWGIGVFFLFFVALLWFISLQLGAYSQFLVWLWWSSPFIASFIAVYFSSNRKLLIGVSLAVPASVISLVFNTIYQLLGNAVDFPDIKGGVILMLVTLAYNSVLCALGAWAGNYLTREINGVSLD